MGSRREYGVEGWAEVDILLEGPVVVGVAGGLAKGGYPGETTRWASLARGFCVGGWVDVGLRGDGGGAGKSGGWE